MSGWRARRWAFGLALLAGLVGMSRVATGAHYPGDVLAGFGIGAAIAVARRAASCRRSSRHVCLAPRRCGWTPRPARTAPGVVLVVNPASGSGTGARVIDEVREALPQAEIVELGDGDDVVEALRDGRRARRGARRRRRRRHGVLRGAESPIEAGVPLAVFPAGTFNHFAKDIGCDTVAKTVEAIRERQRRVRRRGLPQRDHTGDQHREHRRLPDVRPDPREARTQDRQAAGAASTRCSTRCAATQPVRITYDNKTLQTSLFFLGNSIYLPSGFAPSRRTRMDDGLIDVRILETGRRFSTAADPDRRSRWAGWCAARSITSCRCPSSPSRAWTGRRCSPMTARSGPSVTKASFSVRYRALPVFRPLP